MGLFKGKIVNLDRHFMSHFRKKRIGKDKHPTRNISMKGVNASFTHDQETGDPIFVRADYPGLKPEDVAIPMLNTTEDIIGDEMETAVFDKWFSVGSLLDYIDKEMEIEGIFEKILNIEAFVRSKGEKIRVTYSRYLPELVPLFKDLNEKLKGQGINPNVPWLNNKILEFYLALWYLAWYLNISKTSSYNRLISKGENKNGQN